MRGDEERHLLVQRMVLTFSNLSRIQNRIVSAGEGTRMRATQNTPFLFLLLLEDSDRHSLCGAFALSFATGLALEKKGGHHTLVEGVQLQKKVYRISAWNVSS